jgi:tagatose 1,6-diphosphate aldolase
LIPFYPSIIILGNMKNISIGKIRGLQQITGKDGIFTICAMDHRGSMLSAIKEKNPALATDAEMTRRKLELCSSLSPHATAVLLDPIYGAAQCIGAGVLSGGCGLLVSVEESGYGDDKEHRLLKLLAGWSVEKIKRLGASAVKILAYYRSDLGVALEILKVIEGVANECLRHDIPFLVEPVTYPVGEEIRDAARFAAVKEKLVLATAQDITALPVDVLKSEFPADPHYQKDKGRLLDLCSRLDNLSRVPWVVLSAGVDFETFRQQVEIACQAGASGFLAGRAIWQEVVYMESEKERRRFLETIAVDRLKRLTEIAAKHAVPWYKKHSLTAHDLADITATWYREY